ncbi:hypothetical protein LguiB_005686 [Lonicera macranthoides]
MHHITAKQHHLHKILALFRLPLIYQLIESTLCHDSGKAVTSPNSLRTLSQIYCSIGQCNNK